MGSLYEFPYNLSRNSHNPLLDELLSYLPTHFSSHIFDYIVYKDSNDDPYFSDSDISAFYSDNSTYFSKDFENDVCAIPISTYLHAARKLRQNTRGVGRAHTNNGLPGTLFKLQEATPSCQVAQTRPELAVCPHAKQPKKFRPLARNSWGKPSNSSVEHFNYGLPWITNYRFLPITAINCTQHQIQPLRYRRRKDQEAATTPPLQYIRPLAL